ncbi:MAG TPA: zinc dependent phospholipase C family protein [Vicinamibacterales bacterium]
MLLLARSSPAYSVLAHESNIDALWASHIRPLLLARYPGTSSDALREARAYAYGGSVIQDLGYYPFGSHFFTNLLHYEKTGDFVEALLHDASDVNDYAFAIGALCHYASDNVGHAIAVNRAVPLIYPKLRRKFGDVVPYDEAKKEHVLVEFAFDVVLAANGGYQLQAYHDFIGFKVATPLVEQAFRESYGVEMKDQFLSEDLAVGTFRHAVGTTIPNVTKVAWEKKQDQIQQTTPGVLREKFVLALPRTAYEQEYGTDYRTPHGLARVIGWLYVIVPKVGPLRPLAFKVPTPEAERLFLDSLTRSRQRFGVALDELRAGHLTLANLNLDTGRPAVVGEYPLADQTRAELQRRLQRR